MAQPVLIQGAEFKETQKGKYACPECSKVYSWRYVRRHCVKEHGYRYWKGLIVYKPTG